LLRRRFFGPILSKLLEPVPVLKDQSFLLGSRPPLQLAFGSQSFLSRKKFLEEDEANGPPVLGITRNVPGMMLCDSVI
jgi:hypothetical protein